MKLIETIQAPFKDPSKRHIAIIITAFLAILLLLIISRIWSAVILNKRTNAALIPNVQVIRATQNIDKQHIVLPGDIKAWHEAPVYARTNGYLKKWYADIGDYVKKDELLAIIETPELDAQLRQAQADVNVMIARSELANITAKRWINLLKSDSVSKQATDEKIHQSEALAAQVIAARANRDRLRELVSFERVIAPFSGVIAARGTDIGDLINEGSHPDAKPLFRIVQSDPLRLYIKIPETYSSRIKPRMTIDLTLAEHPGKHYQAHLMNTADAINPNTRTLLAEFRLDNKKGELLPGSYTKVTIAIPQAKNNVILPVNTIIFRAQGLQVATITSERRVVLKDIHIAIDYGTYVELSEGIKPGEMVIINPSDAIYQGQQVNVVQSQENLGEKKSAA